MQCFSLFEHYYGMETHKSTNQSNRFVKAINDPSTQRENSAPGGGPKLNKNVY